MNQTAALHKLQLEEFDILRAVAHLCDENDIRWILDSGTALGAARHGGFIPWDDDIDISMTRDQFELFLKVAKEQLPSGYSLYSFENAPGFGGFFAKVVKDGTEFINEESLASGFKQGIFIDVLVHDILSEDAHERNNQLRNASIWQKISYLYHSPAVAVPHKGFVGGFEMFGCRLVHIVLQLLFRNRDELKSHFDKSIIFDRPARNGDTIKNLSYDLDAPLLYENIYPAKPISFMGTCFPAARNLEHYLSDMYGNWHQIPALEDRHTHLPIRLVFSDGSVWVKS